MTIDNVLDAINWTGFVVLNKHAFYAPGAIRKPVGDTNKLCPLMVFTGDCGPGYPRKTVDLGLSWSDVDRIMDAADNQVNDPQTALVRAKMLQKMETCDGDH